ncbi:MAG: hypothetical protein KF799_00555 [Bdellovibrionales bacterium]|nr:hypothetical protein [Bdellovibrionales bacterium]
MIRHNGPISGVASSAKFVATAGYDNQVILWDAKSKTALSRGLHDHLANRCEFSADERFLVSASSDYTARIWQLPEMKLTAVLGEHTDDVEMARFSPDGNLVATVSQDGRVRVFNLKGQLTLELPGHRGCAQSLTWSHDGLRIVSSGDDGTIRTWNLATRIQESIIHPENVQTDAVVMTAAGVVYAGNDAGEVLRIENGEITKLRVHTSGIKNLILNKEESALVSLSYDRYLALIDLGQGLCVQKKIAVPAVAWARACTFQNDDRLIFGTFGSSYACLELSSENWDFSAIKGTDCINAVCVDNGLVYTVGDSGEVRSSEPTTVVRPVKAVAEMGSLCNFITRYNDRIVCGGHLGQVFDALTGEVLLTLGCPINKAVQAGDYLVLATYVGELAICRTSSSSGLQLVGKHKVLQNAVKDLAVWGTTVFCGGAAADIALFELRDFRVLASRVGAHNNIINSCVSLGEGVFATVSRDLRLKIWNGVEEVEDLMTPFAHSIKCAGSSHDRRFIAAAAYDGTVAIYDRETKSWPVFRRPTAAGVSSLSFAEGSFWASSYDGNVYRVDLP